MNKFTRLKNNWLEISEIIRAGALKKKLLVISFILLVISTLLEGVGFGLLVPFLKQIAGQGAYEGWKVIPIISDILFSIGFDQWSQRIEWLLVFIIVTVCLRQATLYVSHVMYQSVNYTFAARLRTEAYTRLLSFGCSYFDNQKGGEIHDVVMRFTNEISQMLTYLFQIGKSLLFAIVYIVILFGVSWELGIISFMLMPLFYFTFRGLLANIRNLYHKILRQEQQSYGTSYDVFSNIKLVKACTREEWEMGQFRKIERDRAINNIRGTALLKLFSPIQESLTAVGIGVIIWLSYRFIFEGDSSFLIKLIVSLLLFRRSIGAINVVFSEWSHVVRRFHYFDEVRKLMDGSDKAIMKFGERPLIQIEKGLEYRGVSMSYNGNAKALEKVSFYMPKGSFLAVIGSSGAGKTTLINLLLRFYEYQEGDILIDDISIRDYDIGGLRRAIGYVSQETLVLNDSIYNNIKYANPSASDKEILEAAKNAFVSEYAEKQSKGLHTIIGDKGVKLSGGELQRLSLARIFLRDPQIVILDEATSALDSVSEKMIQAAIKKLSRSNKMMISIAHRLSTILEADQIMVLQAGRIAEMGSRDELLKKKAAFFSFWQAQRVSE